MSNLPVPPSLGAGAEFERSTTGAAVGRHSPFKEGGVYKGRKPSLTKEQVKEIHRRVAAGEQKTGLALEYGVSRQTLYTAIS
jgi:DNA invertase Pin-like site-specific DNA recombinase